jgi:hypothetical protein
MSNSTYLTKNGKFNNELALKDLKEIQISIRLIASEKPTITHLNSEGIEEVMELIELPLYIILNLEQKKVIGNIAQSFARANKFQKSISNKFIYNKLLKLLGNENFYLNETFNRDDLLVLLEDLKKTAIQELSTIKVNIITIVGASLKRGCVCEVGSIKFVNPLDFVEDHKKLLDDLFNFNEGLKPYIEVFHKCDLVAQVRIKNRDTATSKMLTNEIMKRVCTLVRLSIPSCGGRYNFFGSLGEEYLESIFSFLFYIDLEDDEKTIDEKTIKSISFERTSNRFSDNNIDLEETILPHKGVDGWFTRIELIIGRFVNDEELTDFEKRIWTALYWYGEAMSEKEFNSLIIKYATCLEALFNSREGGISEQISEFTAHVIGKNKEERMEIYSTVKKLYSLRSNAVHGGAIENNLDSSFLERIRLICVSALLDMSYYSQEDYYQSPKGYEKFVQYILKEYRFFSV